MLGVTSVIPNMRTINVAGLDLVKRWEGIPDGDPTTVNLDPYLDPVGIWTIGWGHAIRHPKSGKYLKGIAEKSLAFALYPGGITIEQAHALLLADLLDASKDVASLVKVPMNDNQFSALVSFEFNSGALGNSTLLKKLNATDYTGAAEQFGRWVKGRTPDGALMTLNGLVKRRADERALFLMQDVVPGGAGDPV